MRRQTHTRSWVAMWSRKRCSAVMLAILRLPQPVIAAVEATATAAGCQVIVVPHIVDVPEARTHRRVESLTELHADNLMTGATRRRWR